ncbi:hypothetical protein ACY19I_12150 [Morganella morganii]|uniref:hypothetical protein n=1 Tax=Morganella morganii TaxID=582 RepID=UPI003D7F812C
MMEITLTAEQIRMMADFAGMTVRAPEVDMETEFTLQTDFYVESENRNATVFYCTEYPDEGAVEI